MASSRPALGELEWEERGGTVTRTYHPTCGRISILYNMQETHKVKRVFRSWIQCKEYPRNCGYNHGMKEASTSSRSRCQLNGKRKKRQIPERKRSVKVEWSISGNFPYIKSRCNRMLTKIDKEIIKLDQNYEDLTRVLPLSDTLPTTTCKDDHETMATSSTAAVKDLSACLSPIRRPLMDIEHAQQPPSDKAPNPSYRELKDKFFKPSGKRTKLACAVLNDSFVSYNSRGRPFQEVRKNQYEKILFRCEDDHFQLDMLVEWATNTKTKLTDLWHDIRRNRFKPGFKQIHTGILVDKHLSALNFRSSERIYDDDGSDIIDLLRTNRVIALSKILIRLQQKRNEWSGSRREEMNKVWAKAWSKNGDKSPGHSNS